MVMTPEDRLAQARAYKLKNREAIKAKAREYYQKNAEALKAKAGSRNASVEARATRAAKVKIYYAKNPEAAALKAETTAAWRKANPEQVYARSAAWREANYEKVKANANAWAAKNREHVNNKQNARRAPLSERYSQERRAERKSDHTRIRARERSYLDSKGIEVVRKWRRDWHQRNRERILSDPVFILKRRTRARLQAALRSKTPGAARLAMLGCSYQELVKHFETLFAPGMSWDNRKEWHIDHIHPLSRFNLTEPEQLAQACHYTNLQPLWALDNLRKGAKYVSPTATPIH